MPTIVVASPKGGAGKSTTSIILATEFARAGVHVTLLDSDPNKSVTIWSNAGPLPPNLTVIGDITEANIIKLIKEHDLDGQIVIVDSEGVASRKMSRAISQADLIIAPMQPTPLDANVGASVITLIQEEEDALGRAIKYAIAFTKTKAVRSAQHRGIAKSLAGQGVDIIEHELLDRAAYSALFATGGNLHTMPPQGNILAAQQNAVAFANAVMKRLN